MTKLTRFLAMAALVASTGALAQAPRTWVSGVGDDVNPCSRTAPCKTFAGAISKTAAGGEIDVLDSGGFGTLTITKSITIDGTAANGSVLAQGTIGFNIAAGQNDTVILRNLQINGTNGTTSPGTYGIRFTSGGQLHVENVHIYGFSQQGIWFTPGAASQLFVNNSSIRDNTAGGILVAPTATGTATVALDNVSLDGNGRGLRAEDGSTVVVRNSHASGNVANGFVGVGVSRAVDIMLDNVLSSLNGATGVYAGVLTTIKLTNTTTTRNGAGWQAVGGTITSFGNNRVIDNVANNGPANVTVGQQ